MKQTFRAHRRALSCAVLISASSLFIPGTACRADEVVNIYSYREPKLIEPLLKAFTDKTGIKTNVVFANSGLVERMGAEGKNSPADVLLTNEFGLLVQAVAAGVTAPVKSDIIDKQIPAELRDPGGQWTGLTRRARIVYKLTPEGKDRFQAWLADAGPEAYEDELFGVHLAFFSRTDRDIRLRILLGRRNRLEERLATLRSNLMRRRERLDEWTLTLQQHGLDSVEREVDWLSQLIDHEIDGKTPSSQRSTGSTPASK